MENNIINIYNEEEKMEILRNAHTSFVHGIHHLSEYSNGEINIKFTILHIFNTIELLTKAYLGSINLNLLKIKIDDGKYSDGSITVGIETLLKRMKNFSEIVFTEDLRGKIEILRKKRNEIEHKKFILENEENLLITICEIINGLMVFSKNHIYFDIAPDLLNNTKLKFHDTRIKIDRRYAEAIKDANDFKSKGYLLVECPDCLNLTVPYKKESGVECFMCNQVFYVHKCHNCPENSKNLCLDVQNGQGVCDECNNKEIESVMKASSFFEKEDEKRRINLPREDY